MLGQSQTTMLRLTVIIHYEDIGKWHQMHSVVYHYRHTKALQKVRHCMFAYVVGRLVQSWRIRSSYSRGRTSPTEMFQLLNDAMMLYFTGSVILPLFPF